MNLLNHYFLSMKQIYLKRNILPASGTVHGTPEDAAPEFLNVSCSGNDNRSVAVPTDPPAVASQKPDNLKPLLPLPSRLHTGHF